MGYYNQDLSIYVFDSTATKPTGDSRAIPEDDDYRTKLVKEHWFDSSETSKYFKKIQSLLNEGYEEIDQGYGYTSFKVA